MSRHDEPYQDARTSQSMRPPGAKTDPNSPIEAALISAADAFSGIELAIASLHSRLQAACLPERESDKTNPAPAVGPMESQIEAQIRSLTRRMTSTELMIDDLRARLRL
jgi:hypothetical protein